MCDTIIRCGEILNILAYKSDRVVKRYDFRPVLVTSLVRVSTGTPASLTDGFRNLFSVIIENWQDDTSGHCHLAIHSISSFTSPPTLDAVLSEMQCHKIRHHPHYQNTLIWESQGIYILSVLCLPI
jgi:hypothetical protein